MTAQRQAEPVVTTIAGQVRGRSSDGVSAFLGVPYAAPPTERLRFRAPEPAPGWTGVRDALATGPAAPQPPSRLEAALGSMGITEQGEDCLSLNVWVPEGVDGPLPVLVWVHGGAFIAGSGGQPWYDGALLAKNARVVVVTVNYRLGALGFLHVPGTGDAPPATNLGLLDQVAALRWVHDNIAAFGGDPADVVFGGQSAGAASALALLHTPDVVSMVRRLLLQSPPLGMPPLTVDEATHRTELLMAELDLKPTDVEALRAVPARQLLDAQNAVSRALAVPLRIGPAFQLVGDGTIVPPDLLTAPQGVSGVAILIGATDHEGDAFCVPNPQVEAMTHADVVATAAPLLGDDSAMLYQRFADADPSAAPPRIAADLVTYHYFRRDLAAMAATLAGSANPTTTYEFGWFPPGSPLRSCHCMDLPFFFGNLAAWQGAPLLAGATTEDMAPVVAQVQGALRDFVHG